jgi:hypothetical protein
MELYLKEEVVRFKPDDLFVMISNANDFRDAYLGVNKYTLPFGALPQWKADVLRAKIPQDLLGEPQYSTWARKKPYRTGLDRFATYQLLRQLGSFTSSLLDDKQGDDGERIVKRPTEFEVSNLFMSWSFWSRRHYPEVAKRAMDTALGYLSSMKQICDQNDIQLHLVTSPVWQQIYANEVQGIDRNGIEFDISYPQKYVEEFASERSIPYLDLLPELRAYVRENHDIYPPGRNNDPHFSIEGERKIAKALVDFFRKNE